MSRRRPSSFFQIDISQGLQRFKSPPLLTNADIALLPPLLQRYLQLTGAIGKPKVINLRAKFKGKIQPSRDGKLREFSAVQYSFFDEPTRLFLIQSSLYGLPFGAYHRYVGPTATMDVKVMNLLNVVHAEGKEMNQSENVTMLNDMCLLAPATLISPRITWQNLDDTRVKAIYDHNGAVVQAILTFASDGALVDFLSEDRYQTADGKTYKRFPWKTPVKAYRDFHGHRLASFGQATWQEPQGDFTYGYFELVDVEYNVNRITK